MDLSIEKELLDLEKIKTQASAERIWEIGFDHYSAIPKCMEILINFPGNTGYNFIGYKGEEPEFTELAVTLLAEKNTDISQKIILEIAQKRFFDSLEKILEILFRCGSDKAKEAIGRIAYSICSTVTNKASEEKLKNNIDTVFRFLSQSDEEIYIKYIGKIGLDKPQYTATALKLLSQSQDKKATKGIYNIGLQYPEHAKKALKLLSMREGEYYFDVIPLYISNIVNKYSKHATYALEILADRKGDNSTRSIYQIADKNSRLADRALEILKDRKSYASTSSIGYLGQQYPKHRKDVLQALIQRKGTPAGSCIHYFLKSIEPLERVETILSLSEDFQTASAQSGVLKKTVIASSQILLTSNEIERRLIIGQGERLKDALARAASIAPQLADAPQLIAAVEANQGLYKKIFPR